MARPRLPGWLLEFRSNAESREMITGPGNGASQNPAYRPSPVTSHATTHSQRSWGSVTASVDFVAYISPWLISSGSLMD
jgi:hypothetical protein